MNYDKINGDVGFLEGPHRYENLKDPSIKYTSVTTMIEKYGKPFDKDFVSKYKALERILPPDVWKKEKGSIWKNHKIPKEFLEVYNITNLNKVQQDVLDEWASINKESCERGTKIHSELENSFYKAGNNVRLQKFGIGGVFECKKDYTALDLEYGVYPEYLIYYDNPKINLHIAGQIDLLIKNSNDIIIIDHKGLPLDTPIATEDGFKTMQELQVGDKVFDKDGNLCNVVVKSEVHHNPCYKINFDNSESIVADIDHRWLINFKSQSVVLTTAELAEYMKKSNEAPRILNVKPFRLPKKDLPLDPYILGCWLGGGDISGSILESFNNKHIPDIYLRASYEQRLNLLRGIMDTCGYSKKKEFVIDRPINDIIKLLGSLGIKATVSEEFGITFSTSRINPFLSRNEEIEFSDESSYRIITSVEECESVPTQCIAVDSPSHTYVAGYSCIVTHNTNKKIETKGFYNNKTRTSDRMLYPLNNLEECNYNHYQLQLSTYAWMLQKINPEFEIKDLILNHYDHEGKNTLYHCTYLKPEVEKMLKHFTKQQQLELQKAKYARIEY